jgi:hypothetical protein
MNFNKIRHIAFVFLVFSGLWACQGAMAAVQITSWEAPSFAPPRSSSVTQSLDKVNLNRSVDPITGIELVDVKAVIFSMPAPTTNAGAIAMNAVTRQDVVAAVELAIQGLPLVYPNPVHFLSPAGADLGYRLTKDGDIDIQLYDMLGHEVFSGHFPPMTPGGTGAYNHVAINRSTLLGQSLAAGVYFYFISSQGKLLGKGKMGVVP